MPVFANKVFLLKNTKHYYVWWLPEKKSQVSHFKSKTKRVDPLSRALKAAVMPALWLNGKKSGILSAEQR